MAYQNEVSTSDIFTLNFVFMKISYFWQIESLPGTILVYVINCLNESTDINLNKTRNSSFCFMDFFKIMFPWSWFYYYWFWSECKLPSTNFCNMALLRGSSCISMAYQSWVVNKEIGNELLMITYILFLKLET